MLFVSLQCVDILHLRFFYLFTSNSFLVNSNCLASVSASCRLFSAVSTWIRILRIASLIFFLILLSDNTLYFQFLFDKHFIITCLSSCSRTPFCLLKKWRKLLIIFWRLHVQVNCTERKNFLFVVYDLFCFQILK